MHKATATAAALALPMGLVLAATAAHAGASDGPEDTKVLHAQLQPMNETNATGTSTVELRGTTMTVQIHATGLAPGLPHAQHLHVGGENICPTGLKADENGDGFVSTVEGTPYYGPEAVSLTAEGGIGAEHKLDMENMPVADENGKLEYERTFEVSEDIAKRVLHGKAVVVQRGIGSEDAREYDFNAAGPSELDGSLPAQATHPASCGALAAAPERGMETGLGGTSGTPVSWMIGLGAALVTVAGAVTVAGRHLSRTWA